MIEILNPKPVTYNYRKSKDFVTEKVKSVIEKSGGILGEPDVTGNFLDQDTFQISSSLPGTFSNLNAFPTSLLGKIVDTGNSTSMIQTNIKPNFSFLILLVLTLFMGVIFLVAYVKGNDNNFIFWSVAMFILGPFISIAAMNISNIGIRDRFEQYFDSIIRE